MVLYYHDIMIIIFKINSYFRNCMCPEETFFISNAMATNKEFAREKNKTFDTD